MRIVVMTFACVFGGMLIAGIGAANSSAERMAPGLSRIESGSSERLCLDVQAVESVRHLVLGKRRPVLAVWSFQPDMQNSAAKLSITSEQTGHSQIIGMSFGQKAFEAKSNNEVSRYFLQSSKNNAAATECFVVNFVSSDETEGGYVDLALELSQVLAN